MDELVTVEQADAVVRILAWAGPVLGLVSGAIVGAVRGHISAVAWRGLALGLLGPIVWAMWLLYSHLVRYNPATGTAGLHSVATLALNALIFLVAGVALGGLYSRLIFTKPAEETTDTTANHAANDSQ